MTFDVGDILRRAKEATGLVEPAHSGRNAGRRSVGAPGRPGAAPSDPGARRPPRVPFALLVTGLVVGALAALLALNTASAANELQRHELGQRNADIAARVQDLQVQVAASGAPGNLAAAAAGLGMVPAGNPAFVVVGADGRARVLGDPEAATEPPVPAPSTKPKPKPKPTPTSSASKSNSKSKSKSPSASKSKSPSASKSKSKSRSSARPSPSDTPTPVVTLPGGTR